MLNSKMNEIIRYAEQPTLEFGGVELLWGDYMVFQVLDIRDTDR